MPKHSSPPQIALVYDRVNTPFGGAENVLQSLHRLFPDAPLFTSVYDKERAVWAESFEVQPSFLQYLPGAKKYHRQYVGLMPLAFEAHNLKEFDIVISITSAEAKGVLTGPNQLHICYLLTPTRYLWSHRDEYSQGVLDLIKEPIFRYLRWWDVAAAKRPDVIIPISKRVAERCAKYYHLTPSKELYPPVEIQAPQEEQSLPEPLSKDGFQKNEYYLIVSRFVPYKKIDLAIQACLELGKDLVVIGDGPDQKRLRQLALQYPSQAKIKFLHAVQSKDLTAYYKNCRAFLAPGEEDFGIAALEAHLFGKPAVIHAKSGSAEISPTGVSSVQINEYTVRALKKAMDEIEHRQWNEATIQKQVNAYNTQAFESQFRQRVERLWLNFARELHMPEKGSYVRS